MSSRRRNRRSRLAGGSLSVGQAWFLIYGDTVGSCDEPFPSDSEPYDGEAARQAWRRHREQIMAWCPPGGLPWCFMTFETPSFETVAAIRALRLELAGLHDALREFEGLLIVHTREGRPDQVSRFEKLAENVRAVIGELEGGKP
jgi:hypothetical protein